MFGKFLGLLFCWGIPGGHGNAILAIPCRLACSVEQADVPVLLNSRCRIVKDFNK